MSEPELRSEIKKILADYIGDVSKSHCAFLATLDGHLLLQVDKEDFPVDALSPMAGSLLGISETIATQLMDQSLDDAIIMMDKHMLALLKVHDPEDSLYIGIITDRQVNLGMVLTMGNRAIEQIKEIV